MIGAGNMGRHHVRILRGLDGVELVGVADSDQPRARLVAGPFGVPVFPSIDDLPPIDVAVVAVPTAAHLGVATALMERGVHVLVEKPLASTPAEAAALVATAATAGVVLAVGHVERFNPAVMAVARVISDPVFVQFERLSPYTPRIGDSVVFDLMVHDLDLACLFAGGEPVRIESAGSAVFSDTLDVATAVLKFPSGCVATLSASRATQDKVRRIAVSERERFIQADCLRQDVSIKRETRSEFLDDAGGTYRQASVTEIPYLDRRAEPLELELRDFVDAVRSGGSPAIGGDAGLRAVDLARRVEAAAATPGA